MMQARNQWQWVLMLAGVLLLSACGSSYQAPIDQAGEPLYLNAGRRHLVNEGETLYVVAWMYDLDFAALARANNLREPYDLSPGQYLTVDLRSQGGGAAQAQNTQATSNTNNAGPAVATATTAPAAVTSLRRTPLPGADRPARTPLPANNAPATTPAPAAAPPAPAPTPSAPPPTAARRTLDTPPPAAPATQQAKPATPPATTPAEPATPAAVADGAISWAWPHKGSIVGRFSDGAGDNKGVDIAGNAGDPVLAAADGEVVYAGSGLLRYGNLIIIKHNDRFLSAYAHNRALVVAEKDKVKKGQKIAELGSSGIDRNLLHFEIRVDGKPADPLQYLPTNK